MNKKDISITFLPVGYTFWQHVLGWVHIEKMRTQNWNLGTCLRVAFPSTYFGDM